MHIFLLLTIAGLGLVLVSVENSTYLATETSIIQTYHISMTRQFSCRIPCLPRKRNEPVLVFVLKLTNRPISFLQLYAISVMCSISHWSSPVPHFSLNLSGVKGVDYDNLEIPISLFTHIVSVSVFCFKIRNLRMRESIHPTPFQTSVTAHCLSAF